MLERITQALTGRYRVERELGSGGMATVYLATDLRHDRKVAIKVMLPELAESLGGERFLREIRIAAQLSHPHIVGLLDSGQVGDGTDAALYYVMPFMDGETLRARIAREGPLPARQAVRFLTELADALIKAHGQGVIHRDIKPDNIFISDGHAALADFGIARALSGVRDQRTPPGGALATALGMSVGTPAYMAPEQAAADPSTDHRADLYSLGVVGYEMLSGGPLFTATKPHQLVVAHLTETPVPLEERRPGIPLALAAIIMRCLEKDPARRFQSAQELYDALEAVPASDSTATHAVAGPRRFRKRTALVAATIAILAVLSAISVLYFRRRGDDGMADIAPQSLAVMPLANLSGDADNDYFSDGISEEILSAVSRIPGLRVASRTSSFALRGRNLPANDIGRRLKVRHVLDGSVERAGGRVRVRARLTDASTGYQLWSERFDKPEGDLFVLEDEVADAVAGALTQQLGNVNAPDATGTTRDAQAQDFYLRGRQALRTRSSPDDLRKAIAAFERAIGRDSSYARAWAGLGSALVLLPEYGGGAVKDVMPAADSAIRRALALDSLSAEAYAAQGYLRKSYDFDWSGAEQSYRRALAIDPNDANTHQWLGELLSAVGRPSDAMEEYDKAVLLDPESPVVHLARGSQAYARGDSADGRLEFARALEIEPRLWPVKLQQLWMAMAAKDGRADSIAAEVAPLFGDDPRTWQPLVEASRDPAAHPAALLLLRLWSDQGRTPFVIANWYAAIGDYDRAIKTLEETVTRREPYASYVSWWPLFSKLRADPRWQEIRRSLQLP